MRKFPRILAKAILVLLLIAVTTLAALAGWIAGRYGSRTVLPDREQLAALSAAGRLCRQQGARAFITAAEIPPLLRHAILAAEDPDFFERPPSNLVAVVHDILAGETSRWPQHPAISPMSTAVANCLTRSLGRRCWQGQAERHVCGFIMTYRVEWTLARDFTFELYLNETYYGRGTFGPVAAAGAWFAKPLADLTPDEAAFIAALPRSPPGSLARDPARGVERRNRVIDRMQQAGAITAAEAEAAKERPLVLAAYVVP